MNQNYPLVSIGIPVYNGERYLENALNSILAQTFKDFELIISDNGSTDQTEKICRTYAKLDQRIKYFRNKQNLGAGWNFDQVAKLAKGKYFKWACHDDLYALGFLQECVDILERDSGNVLAYPKTLIIDEFEIEITKHEDQFHLSSSIASQRFRTYLHLVRYGNQCHPFHGLIRRSVLAKLLPLGSYPSSDLVFLGKLTLYGKFYEIPDYLFWKRDHAETSVRANKAFRDRIAWYDPTKKGKLHLTRWKWLREYLKAIYTAPLNWQEKFICSLQMLQWLAWNSVWLIKDLLKAALWPLIKLSSIATLKPSQQHISSEFIKS